MANGWDLPPRSIRSLLAEACALYRQRPMRWFGLSAAALTLSWTLDLILRGWAIGDLSLGALDDPRAPVVLGRVARIFAAGVANGMVYALLGFAAQGIVAIDLRLRLAGREEPLPDLLRGAVERMPALAGATFLFFAATALLVALGSLVAGVAAALGLTRGVVPGLLVGIAALTASVLAIFCLTLRWAFFPQVAALEEAGPVEALRRSFTLTRDAPLHSSRLSDLYLFRAAILMACLIGIQLAAGGAGAVARLAGGWLFGDPADRALVSAINPTGMPVGLLIPLEMVSIFLSAAVLPIGLAALTLFYFDVRERRIGADGEPDPRTREDVLSNGGT